MALGCFPLFGRASKATRQQSNRVFENDNSLVEMSSRSITNFHAGFIPAIGRKDSGVTSVTSSTVSSGRSLNVSFNPTVEEIVFDKHEAPSKIRKSTKTTTESSFAAAALFTSSPQPPTSAANVSVACATRNHSHMIPTMKHHPSKMYRPSLSSPGRVERRHLPRNPSL